MLLVISSAWFASLVIVAPPYVFGWGVADLAEEKEKEEEEEEEWMCTIPQAPSYALYASLCCFYLPLALIAAAYARLYRIGRERFRRRIERATQLAEMHEVSTLQQQQQQQQQQRQQLEAAGGRRHSFSGVPDAGAGGGGGGGDGGSSGDQLDPGARCRRCRRSGPAPTLRRAAILRNSLSKKEEKGSSKIKAEDENEAAAEAAAETVDSKDGEKKRTVQEKRQLLFRTRSLVERCVWCQYHYSTSTVPDSKLNNRYRTKTLTKKGFFFLKSKTTEILALRTSYELYL